MKKLLSSYPHLVKEWHPTKNGELTPNDFTHGSKKKVWWKCPKGDDHEWQSAISNRTSSKRGCPFCSGQRVSKTNNLQANNPQVSKEWHPTKNGELNPADFTFKSGKKVWWKCPKGDDHEWKVSIANRSNGHGCPYCSGNKVSKTNNFLFKHPKAAKEWHPTKNKNLKPESFTEGSEKRIWWKCPKGDDHEWITTINDRRKDGCPFCAGKKVGKTNNLLFKFPSIAKEWHPTKNKALRPDDFYYGSQKKVWWKCSEGDDHEWKTSIYSRSKGSKCPYCFGKKTSEDNNLTVSFPAIAKEWHPTKNGNLNAKDFRPHSNKKAWWKCPKDKSHEYQSIINNRTKGFGCPYCSGSGTSQPEIRIFCELNYLIGSDEVVWRKRIDGIELDVFIPKYNLGIEFDGSYWHKEKLESDRNKNELLEKKNIQIIRVRQEPLELISKNDISVSKKPLIKEDLNNIVLKIKSIIKQPNEIKFDTYINHPSFLNDKGFVKFISYFPFPPPEYSFVNSHPEIAKEWHYQKNYPLKPEQFTFGSNKRVWWQCPKGHSYETLITYRTKIRKSDSCPYCAGQKTLNYDLFK